MSNKIWTKQKILAWAIALAMITHAALASTRPLPFFYDFFVYQDEVHPPIIYNFGWPYMPWTKILFWPFTFNRWVWLAVLCCSALYMSHRLIKATDDAWIILLLLSKPLEWLIMVGNVAPILVALSLTPIGVAFAASVKPYYCVFILVHIAVRQMEFHTREDRNSHREARF